MKKVIGSEISPRSRPAPAQTEPLAMPEPDSELEEAAPRMPHSRHMLDLRDKSRHPAPAPAPVPEEPQEVPAEDDLVIRDRVADDVERLGMHQEAEPAGAGSDIGSTEDTGSVRPREGGVTGGAKRKGFFKRLFKMSLVIAGAIFFLLLDIPLPERLIGIYFVASIVYNIDSQRTFIVALIFLVMVAVSSAIGMSVPAESYAVYAFYFLVIGLFGAIREQISNRSKTVGGNSQLSG